MKPTNICKHCDGTLHHEKFDGDASMWVCEDCGEFAQVSDTYSRLTRKLLRDDEIAKPGGRDTIRRRGPKR